jgi:hypothetical protein
VGEALSLMLVKGERVGPSDKEVRQRDVVDLIDRAAMSAGPILVFLGNAKTGQTVRFYQKVRISLAVKKSEHATGYTIDWMRVYERDKGEWDGKLREGNNNNICLVRPPYSLTRIGQRLVNFTRFANPLIVSVIRDRD